MKRIVIAMLAALILTACGAVQTTPSEGPDGGMADKGNACSWDQSTWDGCNWAP